eukprot:1186288-Prorocentrum_minimum.AAC.3
MARDGQYRDCDKSRKRQGTRVTAASPAAWQRTTEEGGNPLWGLSGPHDSGGYNDFPESTGFFRNEGGSWDSHANNTNAPTSSAPTKATCGMGAALPTVTVFAVCSHRGCARSDSVRGGVWFNKRVSYYIGRSKGGQQQR